MMEIPPLFQWAAIVAIIGLTLNGIGTILNLVRRQEANPWTEFAPFLNSVTATMTQIAENLRHLPTKSDLQAEMKDTRHNLVNTAESIHMKVEAGFREVRSDVAEAMRDVNEALKDVSRRPR